MRLSRLAAGVVATTAAVLALSTVPAAAAETVTVHPSDVGTNGWYTADTRAGGSATFTTDYGGALGDGAVLFDTSDNGAQKAQLLTDAWDGTRLADITALGYATYQVEAPAPGVALPALNIRADMDGDGDVDAYLVYEPYQDLGNAAVVPGEWQTWDAYRDGEAKWWSNQLPTTCPQSLPCTWEHLLELYPDATIQEDLTSLLSPSAEVTELHGSIGFNQGSGNQGTVGAADALHIATADRDVTYDFETDVILGGKDDCKQGGWASSTLPVFKNQGDCVSHFASKGKSR
jgi:hypothetical protein